MDGGGRTSDRNYRGLFFLLFGLSFTVLVYSIWGRRVHIDDAWLAEYSYWWSQLGYVKSEAMRGYNGAEIKLFVYHKLFAPQGALLIKLFGFNAYILKSLSLIYLALSAWFTVKIYNKYSLDGRSAWLLLALFISFHQMVGLGFTFRPEMNLVFLGLCSFIFLDKFFERRKIQDQVFSALLAGACAATHLNGAIYVGAGVLLLWIYRRWWSGFFYGAIGSWGILYYLVDVRSISEFQTLLYQFRNWRDIAGEKLQWYDHIIRILNEQQRFLHSPPEIVYTVTLLVVLFMVRKWIYTHAFRLFTYPILLTFLLAAISHGKTTKYIVYAFPFFIILVVLGIESLRSKIQRNIVSFVFGLYFLVNWGVNLYYFSVKEVLGPQLKQISTVIPNRAKVLGPYEYIFFGIQKQRVQSTIIYEDGLRDGKIPASPDAFFALANSFDIEYVILSGEISSSFNIKAQDYGDFKLELKSLGDLLIFERSGKR